MQGEAACGKAQGSTADAFLGIDEAGGGANECPYASPIAGTADRHKCRKRALEGKSAMHSSEPSIGTI